MKMRSTLVWSAVRMPASGKNWVTKAAANAVLGGLPLVLLFLAAAPAAAQAGRPVAEVRGHATDYFYPGDDGGTRMDQITIDAWLDESGNAHGTMVWTSVYLGSGDPGPGISGYPWYMAVTDLMVSGNEAYVQGVVVSSPQVPEDEGAPVWFTVVDNGSGANDPPDEIGVFSSSTVPVVLGNFIVRSDWEAGPPAHEVRGHGVVNFLTGAEEPDAQLIDQISINGWLDESGNAQGLAVWTSVFHNVPADPDDPFFPPGPGSSGYPWYIDLNRFVQVTENVAFVEGVVVHSPQVPEDEGSVVGFLVVDNGRAASGPPDQLGIYFGGVADPSGLSGEDLVSGNYTVR